MGNRVRIDFNINVLQVSIRLSYWKWWINFFSPIFRRSIFGFLVLVEQFSLSTIFSQKFFRISSSDWRTNISEYSSIFKVRNEQVLINLNRQLHFLVDFSFQCFQFHLCFSSSWSPRFCQTLFPIRRLASLEAFAKPRYWSTQEQLDDDHVDSGRVDLMVSGFSSRALPLHLDSLFLPLLEWQLFENHRRPPMLTSMEKLGEEREVNFLLPLLKEMKPQICPRTSPWTFPLWRDLTSPFSRCSSIAQNDLSLLLRNKLAPIRPLNNSKSVRCCLHDTWPLLIWRPWDVDFRYQFLKRLVPLAHNFWTGLLLPTQTPPNPLLSNYSDLPSPKIQHLLPLDTSGHPVGMRSTSTSRIKQRGQIRESSLLLAILVLPSDHELVCT